MEIDKIKSMLMTMPAKDVAKKLGIGRSKLFSILKENNLTISQIKRSQKPSDQAIIDTYSTNNIEDTAKLLGTNKHYVIKVLKRNKIKRTYTKTDNLNIVEVKNYFRDHTLKECGEKFGFSHDQIKRFLKKNGVDTSRHENRHCERSRIDINIDELIKYYQEHNIQECSDHFNCSPSLISSRLKQHGIDTSIHRRKFTEETRSKISESNKKRWEHANQQEAYKQMHVLSVNEIVEKATETHGNKYDYSKVKPGNMRSRIIIMCKEHGEFEQNICRHIKGNGCPECAIEKTKLTQDEFLRRAAEVHGDKYDYSKTRYVDAKTYVTITCPKHGEFKQKPRAHLIHNCPSCPSVISSGHQEIIDFIRSVTNAQVLVNDRQVISPYELDIYLPEYEFAIEHHGLYWHSYDYKESPREKSRHADKCSLCEEMGIRLIQVFENEWSNSKELIKSMLQSKMGVISNKIHARKCDIKGMNKSQHSEFMDTNHLQGKRGCSVAYGLFYDDQLVAAMSFNEHKKYEWEIARFANKLGYIVVGGASKLLNRFVRDYSPNQIMTFADRRYSNGNLYMKLGFKFVGNTSPNYFYIKNNKIHSRQQFMKHKLESKLNQYNPNLTEYENMFLNGYRRLWDAGHAKFIWTL